MDNTRGSEALNADKSNTGKPNDISWNKGKRTSPDGGDSAAFIPPVRPEESKEPQTCLEKVSNVANRIVPFGGIASSVFNLAAVCVGAGILGLPAATNNSGLLMALIYLVVIFICSTFSLHILAKSMEKTGLRTFETMAQGLMGKRFDYFVVAIRWFNSFGAIVAYVISVGDILQTILKDIPGSPDFLRSDGGRRVLTTAVWLFFMLPLVLPKMVNSLRYVSTIAVIFVLYFVMMIVIHSSLAGLPYLKKVDGETIKLFNTGNDAIGAVGVFIFAFVCQINCFEVYWEMKDRSVKRFTIASAIAMIFCGSLYFLTVFFGYMEFGSEVKKSILLMYKPVEEPMVMVGFVGMLVKLCASYALNTMACRNTMYHLIGWEVSTLPYWKHIPVVIVFSVVVLLCGLFIPNINTVLGLVGALCGGFISFVFPALFYLYSGGWSLKSVGWMDYILTYALLLAGVVGIVFGTIATVFSTATGGW